MSKSVITRQETEEIAEKYWIDLDVVPLYELQWGLNREMENLKYSSKNLSFDDRLEKATRIFVKRLLDAPDYYARLQKLETKAEKYWDKKGKRGLPPVIKERNVMSDEEDFGEEDHDNFTDALMDNDLERVRGFVESGADVNVQLEMDGTRPLHKTRDVRIAEYLINNGAIVDIEDSSGWTPFMYKITEELYEVADYLLQQGADINHKDKNNKWSRLNYSIDELNVDDVKYLVKRGAEVDISHLNQLPTDFNQYLDPEDVKRKVDEIRNILTLEERRAGNITDHYKVIDLRHLGRLRDKWCEDVGNNQHLRKLRGMAKSLEIPNYKNLSKEDLCADIGMKVVFYQVTGKQLPLTEWWEKDEEDGIPFEPDWTPLMNAIHFNNLRDAYDILQKKRSSKIDYRSKKTGTSALMIAVSNNNLKAVQILLDNGANPDQKNKLGHTPLSIATIGKNNDIVKELVMSGAKLDKHIMALAKDDGFGEKNEELLKIFKCAKVVKRKVDEK